MSTGARLFPMLALLVFAALIGRAAAAQNDSTPAVVARPQHVTPYAKWLNEDVRWIITQGERAQFLQLSTDAERDKFIEAFWKQRDPNPRTAVNEYKQEHYRRLTYANGHFAHERPGWMSDRGRAYIVFGPPDQVDSHPGTPDAPPYDIWHYAVFPGVGKNVTLTFTDPCRCGEYKLQKVEPHKLLFPPETDPDSQTVPVAK